MSSNSMLNSIKNFAADIDYFERMVSAESASFKAELTNKISNTTDPYQHLEIVADHFCDVLALLSARIKLVESAFVNQHASTNKALQISGDSPRHTLKLVDELLINADSFGSYTNFYGVEKTDAGLYYSWTGPSPVNVFELPITRDEEKFGQLHFIAIVDETLLQTLTLKLDGDVVEFQLGTHENQNVLEFKIPSSKDQKPTALSLNLTNTVSPL